MKIKQIKFFIPASIEIELTNGGYRDILVMLHMPTKTILVPDDKDVAFLEDYDIESFEADVWSQVAEAHQIPSTPIPFPQDEWDAVGTIIGSSKQKVDNAIKKARV